MFLNDFFKDIRKEINKLLGKGMLNIYLKVTIEKKGRTQTFDFLTLKSLSTGQFLESSNSRTYHRIFKLLVAILNSEVCEPNCVWLFCYFCFERNYDVLKSRSPCFLLNKMISLIKMRRNRKFYTQLKRDKPCALARIRIAK